MNKREAATRLKKNLLLGAGAEQTKLKYHQEVDFGRQQLTLIAKGSNAADITLLQLSPIMVEIKDTTEALARGIGYGDTHVRPAERLRVAVMTCASTFGGVASELALIVEHGMVGADRECAAKLLVSLETLSARYPAGGTSAPTPQAPATPNDNTTTPDDIAQKPNI